MSEGLRGEAHSLALGIKPKGDRNAPNRRIRLLLIPTQRIRSSMVLNHRILGMALALLALGHLQVFGAMRIYLCACAPEVRTVHQAICHGSSCHPEHAHQDGCAADASGESPDHSHQHVTLHDGSHEGTPSDSVQRPAAPRAILCRASEQLLRVPPSLPPRLHRATAGESPPRQAAVDQSVVRLI